MKSIYIIADDTTGANSSAILLNKLGYNAISLHKEYEDFNPASVYALSTNSRGVDKDTAYNRVFDTLKRINDQKAILNKRVDSTLRGNIGYELNAFLDVYPNKKAVIVPCFPKSGRICKENILYVNGVKLHETDVAKDPKCPINTSNVYDLFKSQIEKDITAISIKDVHGQNLARVINDNLSVSDIVIIDAITNEDIEKIADVITKLKLDIITVDPGPFTYYYAKSQKKHRKILLNGLVCSTTPLSSLQMKYIEENDGYVYEIDFNKIIGPEYLKYKDEVLNVLKKVENNIVIITSISINEDKVISLKDVGQDIGLTQEELSDLLNNRMSELFIEFSNYRTPDVFYTSGGDTTLAFLNMINSYGLKLSEEIIPLTVYSEILGGTFNGVHLVSKGGLIGDEFTINDIYQFVKEGKNNE
ncbi:hypothetical protein CI105_06300 [Candidatus Izimaplasma bacterium ZiA1]|uniref:four-carbon acid sugar kinase family protein n=1 Tax=Candidatus Izimoplasma sp. ZiA1 TaxID=2024899 RepID=UPI000BAA95A9|nr:hypothetical protein CI105_06300 [Candidatus Izimaplasma bacterium ZiA1]